MLNQVCPDSKRCDGSSLTNTPLTAGARRPFRGDIEGLRAIAVGLVLLYHAGVPALSGGYVRVDVFFVISGFLITGMIVGEMERTGGLDLLGFYNRRIRRLLPATALVLGVISVVTLVALPATRWADVSGDVFWSALYSVNWRLAHRAVDYLAIGHQPSPAQHFWSLSVEEQFYFVWPVFLLLLSRRSRLAGRGIRGALLWGLIAVALPSFGYWVYLTGLEPGRAYFVTPTRIWELALGGGLAILAPSLKPFSRRGAELLALVGLVGILSAGWLFDSTTLFPGFAALLPVGATMAVIIAGTGNPGTTVARWLGAWPMRMTGALSYSLYLWHWPLIVGAKALWGDISPAVGLGVVAASVLPAWLTFRFVETPFRHWDSPIKPARRGLCFGVLCTGMGVGAGLIITAWLPDVDSIGRVRWDTHFPRAGLDGTI